MRKAIAVAAAVSALALGFTGSASAATNGCQGLLGGPWLQTDGKVSQVAGTVYISCTAGADKMTTYKGNIQIKQADGTWERIEESQQGDSRPGSFDVKLDLRATCVPGTHAYRVFGASSTDDGTSGHATGEEKTFTC